MSGVTLEYQPFTFSADRNESFRMMSEMERICDKLPGIDCGSCGAPTCRAFASDVVRGDAQIEECVVFMREKLKKINKDKD